MPESRGDIQAYKRELRRERLESRACLDPHERHLASTRIADRVVHAPFFRRSRKIACYLSTPDEVDTWRIIGRAWRMKKQIFVPVTQRDRLLEFREITPQSDLVLGNFGLLLPVSGNVIAARELDLVLTPLVAFDDKGERIGMGGGYYDRTFSFLRGRQQWLKPKLVGLAFACQRIPQITANPWDIRLYSVITDSD